VTLKSIHRIEKLLELESQSGPSTGRCHIVRPSVPVVKRSLARHGDWDMHRGRHLLVLGSRLGGDPEQMWEVEGLITNVVGVMQESAFTPGRIVPVAAV